MTADKKKRILFVENQAFDLDTYPEALMLDYEVDIAFNLLQARDFVDDKLPEYDLIVLDVMMPSLGFFPIDETDKGLQTGLRFFDDYLDGKPADRPVGVVFLTAAAHETLDKIQHYYRTKKQCLALHRKTDVDSTMLKADVDRILGENSEDDRL